MNPIVHRAPSGGGSARGCARYILGYAAAVKGSDRIAAREQLSQLFDLADSRPDRGVGEPIITDNNRPSIVWARNVTGLSTAHFEIDALAAANTRIRQAVMHMTIAFGNDPGIDQTRAMNAVENVLERVGFGHLPRVAAGHNDTEHYHVHLAIGMVDPKTMRAVDRTRFHERVHQACRQVELEMGLTHDFGLYKIANGEIKLTTYEERAAYRKTLARQRGEQPFQKAYEVKAEEWESFEKYADRTIGPRVREALDQTSDVGLEPTWNDVHRVIERYGVIEETDGRLYVREMSRDGEMLSGRVAFDEIGLDQLEIGPYRSREESQEMFVASVMKRPDDIVKGIERELAVFLVDDMDEYICERIFDVDEAMRVRQHVLRNSESLVRLTDDSDLPVMTTKANQEAEQEVIDLLERLILRPVEFDAGRMRDTILRVEEEERAREIAHGDLPAFALSAEQCAPLHGFASGLIAIRGRAGTGKTTLQRTIREYADVCGKEIVGLTLAQAAAEELELAAGFRSINTARARTMEERGKEFIPHSGIVVMDEAGMTDTRTTLEILRLAEERQSQVVMVFDNRQLGSIDAGQPSQFAWRIAKEHGSAYELNEIRRQRDPEYAEFVRLYGDAIEEQDRAKKRGLLDSAFDVVERNGWISWYDTDKEAITAALDSYLSAREKGEPAIFALPNKELCRWANEEARRRLGLQGVSDARSFETSNGRIELAQGDRIVFLRNNTRLGIANGYLGDVIDVSPYRIEVQTLNGQSVHFDPRKYTTWDYGHAAQTIHKSQGASVSVNETMPNRGVSIQGLHVATSRGRDSFHIRLSRESFDSLDTVKESLLKNDERVYNIQDFEELDFRKQRESEMMRVVYELRRDRADATRQRKRYHRYVERERTKQADALHELRESFDERRARAASLSNAERRAESLDIRREFERQARALTEQFTPMSWERWRAAEYRESIMRGKRIVEMQRRFGLNRGRQELQDKRMEEHVMNQSSDGALKDSRAHADEMQVSTSDVGGTFAQQSTQELTRRREELLQERYVSPDYLRLNDEANAISAELARRSEAAIEEHSRAAEKVAREREMDDRQNDARRFFENHPDAEIRLADSYGGVSFRKDRELTEQERALRVEGESLQQEPSLKRGPTLSL